MLSAPEVIKALNAAWDRIQTEDSSVADLMAGYWRALARYLDLSSAEIGARLAENASPGALPTGEHDGSNGCIPFPQTFAHHREAREWAADQLRGVSTLAVDGSQIRPTKDYSIPIGVVQVGWFLNHHLPDLPYEKGVRTEVLSAEELRGSGGVDDFISSSLVDLRRFEMEAEQCARAMRDHAGEKLLVFFDGSLVVSFVEPMPERLRASYVRAVLSLLAASEETGVPVVGYLDTSFARDLCGLLASLWPMADSSPISDAALINGKLKWGDRTPVYHCRRAGILQQYLDPEKGDHRQGVCFAYLQAASDRAPARLELPRWVFESGQSDWVFDVVRAEIIAGAAGYPYPIEAADAVAVLTMEDRERFYGILQGFARDHGMPLSYAAKARSKRTRR